MGEIIDGFRRAIHTRKAPAGWGAQLKFLMRGGRTTKQAAEQLGVSQRSVQRWLAGTAEPGKKAAEAMQAETVRQWQPRVKAAAKKRAASRGFGVHMNARWGYQSAGGSTDDPRMRVLTQSMPGEMVGPLWDAFEAGDEAAMQDLIAQGMGQYYFRDDGRRADGLRTELTELQWLELDIWPGEDED